MAFPEGNGDKQTERSSKAMCISPANAPLWYRSHLTESQLRSLVEYKYHGEDRSLTYKYILGPLYDRLIHLLPLWLAPNMITLIGFTLTLIGHMLLMYHAPHLSEAAPRWVYLYSGTALLSYMVLDNLDGRQARRTRSSSPLGHLFDHGCDAFTVTLSGMSMLAMIRLGGNLQSFLMMYMVGHQMLFCANLEEYFTGAMILREINGPNEGIIFMALLQLLTGIAGSDFWNTPYTINGTTFTPNIGMFYFSFIPALNAVLFNLGAIALKLGPIRAAKVCLTHGAGFGVFGICYMAWAHFASELFGTYVVKAFWLSGLYVFDLVSRMILSHLTRSTPYPFVTPLLPAVLAPAVMGIAAAFDARFVHFVGICMNVSLAAAAGYTSWRIACLITQLTTFFDIYCLRLGPRGGSAVKMRKPH